MKVLLRLRGLTTRQHQDLLLATDECGALWPAVEYKGSTHDKDGHNIDLKIESERGVQDDGYTQTIVVTREETFDKLCDTLHVFPQMETRYTQYQLGTILEEVGKINSLTKEVLTRFPDLDSDPDRTGLEVMAIDKMGAITTICHGIKAMGDFDQWTRLSRIHDAIQTAYQIATDWSHDLPTPGSVEKGSATWVNSMGVGDIRTQMEATLRTLDKMRETEIP